MKKILLLLAAALPLALRAEEKTPTPVKLVPEAGFAEIAKSLADRVPAMHLNHGALDDAISLKAFELFLDSLDYDRTYFTAEDEAAFRQHAKDLDDMTKAGDLAFPYEVFETYKERVRNRVAFVNQLLDGTIDTSVDETFDWKRDKAPRVPAAQWDDLWRRKIKHQYVGKLVAKEMDKIKAAESNATAAVTNEVKAVAAAAAATNQVAAAGATTNATETAASPVVRKPPLTPVEDIKKQYHQLLSVMESHDAEFLLTIFLNSITRAYDTHTNYMSTRNEEDFDITMRLSLQGIGALLEVEEGAPTIKELVPGGPAERDGRLKPGDRILAVQQGKTGEVVDILYWPLYKSVRIIRGAKGSTVVLHVAPASDRTGGKVELIDIVRDEIKLEDRGDASQAQIEPRRPCRRRSSPPFSGRSRNPRGLQALLRGALAPCRARHRADPRRPGQSGILRLRPHPRRVRRAARPRGHRLPALQPAALCAGPAGHPRGRRQERRLPAGQGVRDQPRQLLPRKPATPRARSRSRRPRRHARVHGRIQGDAVPPRHPHPRVPRAEGPRRVDRRADRQRPQQPRADPEGPARDGLHDDARRS
ncbi:MAG: PDZ domain-containing protein [Kiritimatiellia bacterium]